MQSELCEELLVPEPFLQPLLEMLPRRPLGILGHRSRSTLSVSSLSLAALQEVPKLAPVLGGTNLIYIKKGGEACHIIQNNQMTYGLESMNRSHAGNRTGRPVTG